jgi:ADYC domain
MDSCRTLAFMASVALAGSGCTALSNDAETPEPALTLSEVHQGLQECPEDTCGSNSPKIETLGFHELSVRGDSNAQDMRLVGATLNGAPVSVSVLRAQLAARSGLFKALTGAQLVGLQLFIEARIKDETSTFQLEVMAARSLRYPVPAGSKDGSGAYVIEYTDRDGQRRNLCTANGGGSPDLPWDEAFGQHPTEAVFFEGDRIDTATMTIDPNVDASWFNIGCAGHTLAKLHLTRNTTASNAPAFGHQLDDRQATLKMFVADYCGTGKPFTVAGQRLAWRDDQGVMEFYDQPFSLEARWQSYGAACLSEPRMLYPSTIEGAQRFPKIWQAIADECPALLQQPCADEDPYSFDGLPRVTGNR